MKAHRIVALLSQKGGAGKTTVTMQLAAGLARRGFKVGIGDLDPQESALRWAESAPEDHPFPAEVRALTGDAKEITAALKHLSKSMDIVLLDCPPSIEHSHTLTALDLADLALVPVVPSPPDLWSARAVERLILQRMGSKGQLKGAMLPNRVQRTALAGNVLEVMREFTLPVLNAALSQRNAYAQSAVIGASVYDLGKAAEASQLEIDWLVDAVMELLGRTS